MVAVRTAKVRLALTRSTLGVATPEPIRLVSTRAAMPRVEARVRFCVTFYPDGLFRRHKIRDWAEAARLVGVTRARMTQIANLLLLAPEIQERILNLGTTGDPDPITERALRKTAVLADWRRQRCLPMSADRSVTYVPDRSVGKLGPLNLASAEFMGIALPINTPSNLPSSS